MSRVAVYARVSTSEQTVEPQIHALREYALSRGLEIVEEYADEGVSGARGSRPALDELLKAARRRTFDVLAVQKLDRLGRSLHHLLTILGELEDLGIGFVSLDDGLDSSTAAGRLFFSIRGAFCEYERALIRERTCSGLAAAKRRGKRLGRPRAIRGPDTFKLERGLAEGRSIRSIASELEVCRATVIAEATRLGLRRSVA